MHRALIGWIKARRDDGSSATTRERIHRRAVVAVVEWRGGNTIHPKWCVVYSGLRYIRSTYFFAQGCYSGVRIQELLSMSAEQLSIFCCIIQTKQ